MFGRRQHKLSDEDEPLVPHGLVWQATEESVPAEQPPKVESEAPRTSAQPLAMPVRKDPLPPDSSVPRPLGAISPPIQWPSPSIQKIIRPAQAPEPPKQEISSNAPALQLRTEKDRSPGSARAILAVAEKVASDFSRRLHTAGQSWSTRSLETLRRARIVTFRIRIRVPIKDQRKYFVDFASASLAAAEKVTSDFGRYLTAAYRKIALTAVEKISSARGYRLRIRIRFPNARRLRAPMASASIAWRAEKLALQRNSRLLTSLAMAAFSAVLALVFISRIQRYAPEPASGIRASTDQRHQMPHVAGVKSVAKPAATGTHGQTPYPRQVVPAAKVVQRQTAARPASTASKLPRRKIHHSDDEDYVAKDTYVYYGSAGKPSR